MMSLAFDEGLPAEEEDATPGVLAPIAAGRFRSKLDS